MTDGALHLETWLADRGFDNPGARELAVEALRQAGILSGRPKVRIAAHKAPRAAAALRERFAVHCESPHCAALSRGIATFGGRHFVQANNRSACQVCGGSNTRRAFVRARMACEAAGLTSWLIVGGSPVWREKLKEFLEELRGWNVTLDDGRDSDTKEDRARARRAQAIAIIGGSQIAHKHTRIYQVESRDKVVLVSSTGLEALFEEMEERARPA